MQAELIFPGHSNENNRESADHLNRNYDHFSRQCAYIFDWLMMGNSLTVKEAMVKHNINSAPRRLMDLRENGVRITCEWVYHESDPKYKKWFCSPEDKAFNRKFYTIKTK